MKKLMIAAAAAAMIGAAEASTQVYQMSMNVLTTTCASGVIAAGQNPFEAVPAGQVRTIAYRTPTSYQILGLIWMCECDYLVDLGLQVNAAGIGFAADNWRYYVCAAENGQMNTHDGTGALIDPPVPNGPYHTSFPNDHTASAEGYIFWEASSGTPIFYGLNETANGADPTDIANWAVVDPTYNPGDGSLQTAGSVMPTFQWNLLQRIGGYAEQIEGVWRIFDNQSGATAYDITGAGFGQMAVSTEVSCDEVISYMYGYFAGFGPVIQNISTPNTCVFCGNDGQNFGCRPYPFCNCQPVNGAAYDRTKTAVTGVWQLVYDPTLSALLLNAASIRDIFPFSDATARMVRFLEVNRR